MILTSENEIEIVEIIETMLLLADDIYKNWFLLGKKFSELETLIYWNDEKLPREERIKLTKSKIYEAKLDYFKLKALSNYCDYIRCSEYFGMNEHEYSDEDLEKFERGEKAYVKDAEDNDVELPVFVSDDKVQQELNRRRFKPEIITYIVALTYGINEYDHAEDIEIVINTLLSITEDKGFITEKKAGKVIKSLYRNRRIKARRESEQHQKTA